MSPPDMTSLERVLTALSYREPDRVPSFINASLHAARRLGLGLREACTRPEHVVAVQVHLREWLGNDLVTAAAPAATLVEPWGGAVEFHPDGPPTTAPPPLRVADLARLEPPDWKRSAALVQSMEATRRLVAAMDGKVPVVGVVVAPFSLPVMQLGFDTYLDVMLDHPAELKRLLAVNTVYCREVARAQVAAGANVMLCYDPVCSPTCVPLAVAREVGLPALRECVAGLGVPLVVHLASGRALPLLQDLADLGAVAVGVSAQEDVQELKTAARGRVGLLGNLNALEMANWSPARAERELRQVLTRGAVGGGLVLSDNHGEIPWTVPDAVVETLAETVQHFGRYPLVTWHP